MRWRFWKGKKKMKPLTRPMSSETRTTLAEAEAIRLQLVARQPEIRHRVDETRQVREQSLELHERNHFGESLDIAMGRRRKK